MIRSACYFFAVAILASRAASAIDFCQAQINVGTRIGDSGTPDFFSYTIGLSDPEVCYTMCLNTPVCVGFNYVTTGRPDSGGPGVASSDGTSACYFIADVQGAMTCDEVMRSHRYHSQRHTHNYH